LPAAELIPAEATATPTDATIAQAAEAMPPISGNGAVVSEAAAATAEKKSDEPEMIDVWRPGGRSEKRPPRARRPQRAQQAPAQVAAPAGEAAPADAATPVAATAETPHGDRKDGPSRQQRQDRHERQQRMERQAKSFDNKSSGPRPGQPSGRPAGGGPPRGDRPRRDKGSQVERAEREQYYAKPHGTGGSDRNKAPDPNSPFAKLAALKQQLEQGNKP
jgi:ATP-dependent RNA helicase SUPV3L1/SUV3